MASPAVALPSAVEGCGDAPSGAELTRAGDVCQVAFTTAGESTWTVPSGLRAIHAVVVGAGGGAYGGPDAGYAGSGGEVVYVDLSDTQAGQEISLTVGAGGSSAEQGQGEGSALGLVSALGGVPGADAAPYCDVTDRGVFTAGHGAGGSAVSGSCSGAEGAGIDPSVDDDSRGLAPLDLFSTYAGELGGGGRIDVVEATNAPAIAIVDIGRGADVSVDTSGFFPVGTADAAGDDGAVIIRYPAAEEQAADPEAETDAAPELAETGAAETAPLAGVAALLLGVGAAALAVARRRSASN